MASSERPARKRLDEPFFINKINLTRLRDNILSILWQDITKCKFNEQIMLSRISENFLVMEVAASYSWLCGPFFGSPWAWALPPQI